MANIQPKSCPECNGDMIDTQRKIITHFEKGEDKVQVWAFCRNCGHRSLGAVGRLSIEDGKVAALKLWNQEA